MKLRFFYLICAIALPVLYSHGQSIGIANIVPNNKSVETSLMETMWNEDPSARTLFTSTYYSEDNQIKIVNSKVPINYINEDGKLFPIDPTLETHGENAWAAINQPFPTYLNKDGSFALSLDEGEKMVVGGSCTLNDQVLSTKFDFKGNSVLMENVFPGVDKELDFRENGVKYNYILREPLGGLNSYVFSETLDLPEGYRIERDPSFGEENEFGWSGNLVVLNKSGRTVGQFRVPLCYDNLNNQCLGYYKLAEDNGQFIVELHVPHNWINDPARAYPIVIDPLITGPTSIWTGSPIPSCIYPAYGADSLLVTIPGGVTITQLNVTTGFYAITPAVMEDGRISFATACGTTGTYSVAAGTGQQQGTVNMQSTNVYNPLTCCFNKTCSDTSFYLSYHLSRVAPGSGCNTNYVYYSTTPPAFFTAANNFTAVVIGKTPEAYSGQWSVPLAARCANDCDFSANAFIYNGVPPYTVTHPWSSQTVVQGTNSGCSTGASSIAINLTIPNCPVFCDENYTSLDVPPPTVVDACGTSVTGLPTRTIPIKPVPQVSAIYDTLVCSEESFTIPLEPCIAGANLTWVGNGETDTTYIMDTVVNNGSSYIIYNYAAWATLDGCDSDTSYYNMYIQPQPTAQFTSDPDPVISGNPVTLTNTSDFPLGNGAILHWDLGDGTITNDDAPIHVYPDVGTYTVCLFVIDDALCTDSICDEIKVVPAEVHIPNIVTPNNDGINDLLVFNYLDFYPDNELYIFNRWGNTIYHAVNYNNDWNGSSFEEGTYFFKLYIKAKDETHDGYFQLVKD